MDVKNVTMVTIENCTFGEWMFTQVLQVNIKDCISKKPSSLIFHNASGLLENIIIKASNFGCQLRVYNYSYIQILRTKFVNNVVNTTFICVSDSSTLEMSNCSMKNNKFRDFRGTTLILVSGSSTLNLSNFIMQKNRLMKYGIRDPKNKGLVLLSNSSLLISKNSTFDRNTGTVVMLVNNSSASIVNSLFSGNSNEYEGGLLLSKYSSLLISGTSFEYNTVGNFGGVISGITSTVTIGESLLKKNIVLGHVFTCNMWYEYKDKIGGGPIFATDFSQTIIYNSLFMANIGSSIFFRNNVSLQIDSCHFLDNSAPFAGGAVAGSYSMANITNTIFIQNNATMGAALYVDKSDIIFCNCSFTDNFASLKGGALMISKSNIQIFSNNFSRNIATNGGIFAGNGHLFAQHCLMFNNTAKSHGGVGYFEENSKIYITTSIFRANVALGSGGVLSIRNGFVTVTKSSFEQNSAEVKGGVFFMENSCNIQIFKLICLGNNVKYGVGGVLNAERQTKVYVKDAKIQQNSALFCGAMYIGSDSTLKIRDSEINNNTAIEHFGALCVHNNSVLVAINSFLKENSGSTGASLAVTSSAAYLNNCTLIQNNEDNEVIMFSLAELRLSKTFVLQAKQQYVIYSGEVYDVNMTNRKFGQKLQTYRCFVIWENITLKSDTTSFKQIAVKEQIIARFNTNISNTPQIAETQYASGE